MRLPRYNSILAWALPLLIAATPMPPAIPGTTKHVSAAVHQGAGASDLLAKPKVVVPPTLHWANIMPPYYFSATATGTNDLCSTNSNEISFTNQVAVSNGVVVTRSRTVNLAWSVTNASTIKNCTIYRGDSPGVYSTNFTAGNNTTLTVTLARPLPPVLKNIAFDFPGSTNVSVTNPTAPYRFWKAPNIAVRKF